MTTANTERRIPPRQRTFWKGKIVFGGGLRSVECIVRNFNDQGAKLECGIGEVPDHFDLVIPQNNGQYRCKVVWRRLPELGVCFQEAEAEGIDRLAGKLRTLEEQNRKLLRRLTDTD